MDSKDLEQAALVIGNLVLALGRTYRSSLIDGKDQKQIALDIQLLGQAGVRLYQIAMEVRRAEREAEDARAGRVREEPQTNNGGTRGQADA